MFIFLNSMLFNKKESLMKVLSKALLLFLIILYSCKGVSSKILVNYKIPIKQLIDSLHISPDNFIVKIDKSDYTLSMMVDTLIIKQYPVVFGGNPVDDKRMQGDNCTPEGVFGIRSKYPHKSWSKFIWIDYPNKDSWKKYNSAKQKGEIPKDAKIGGEIGIHGVPENTDFLIETKVNWTLGCISLKNKDVDEIYKYINDNTKVVIQK